MSSRPSVRDGSSDNRETPLRRQYETLKEQHPDCLLLFQLGDFFESFEDDARTVARVCGVTLTSRELGKGDRVALAGVPVTRLDHYLARLLEAGVHVAIAEQMAPPGHGLVERTITRVVTPGTLAEPGLLREKENNYLAALARGRSGVGLAYVDVTTGEFAATQIDCEEHETRLRIEIERLAPAELLVVEGQESTVAGPGQITVCQAWRFDEAAARERLTARLGVLSLEGFGCSDKPLAVRAAGAIMSYLEENNRRLLPNLVDFKIFSGATGLVLDSYTQRNLEILRGSRSGRVEGSLLGVLDRTSTPMGGRLLRRWIGHPLTDRHQIDARLDAIEALVTASQNRSRIRGLLKRVGDVERLVGRVVQGVASAREALALAEALRTIEALRAILDAAALPFSEPAQQTIDLDAIDPNADVAEMIQRGVALPGSGRLIRSGYSDELDALVARVVNARQRITALEQTERERTGIKSLKIGYNKVFGYYIEVTRPNLAHVPPDYHRKQTLVQTERFITPDLKDWEAEILQAEERIQETEEEAYALLLRQVAAQAPRLRRLANALARLDVFAALADLASERGYCRPRVDDSIALHIIGARHPVVESGLDPGAFIPNDCDLDARDGAVMVLTGPNMAGKSTYLREVALIALMAHAGSFVPAREARIGLVDRIFTRVGAQDDIAAGASTFMVEMMETANILRHATTRGLIVLDEIGRGTSTFDGLAIARAVVEEIHQHVGARTLFATHFHELARWAERMSGVGVFNVSVVEENGEVIFLRKVVPGAADRSYGIYVARLAGLPARVTQRAEIILHELESAGPAPRSVHPSNGHTSTDDPLLQQLAFPGIGPLPRSVEQILAELIDVDPATLTPFDALARIQALRRHAGVE